MNLEQYIYSLGMMMSDVKIDQKGRLFILVEGTNSNGSSLYEEIPLPEEYQTFGNVDIIRQFNESIK